MQNLLCQVTNFTKIIINLQNQICTICCYQIHASHFQYKVTLNITKSLTFKSFERIKYFIFANLWLREFMRKQETAKDGMAQLQSKFKNLNTKVNQMLTDGHHQCNPANEVLTNKTHYTVLHS